MSAALVAGQDAATVRGEVRRDDDTLVTGAPVVVVCGEWRHATATDATGRFQVDDVPAGAACAVRAEWPGRPGHGIGLSRSFRGTAYVRLTLPAPLTREAAPSPVRDRLHVSFTAPPLTKGSSLPGGWSLSGTALATAGGPGPRGVASGPLLFPEIPRLASPAPETAAVALILPWSPSPVAGAAPAGIFPSDATQGWSAGITAARRGPWGTLFTGSARARREGGVTTLLNDVTESAMSGTAGWSMLADPSTPMLWDVRLRLERRFELGATDLTVFGEAYRSWLGGPSRTAPLVPLGPQRSSSRSGAAARAGIRLAFD